MIVQTAIDGAPHFVIRMIDHGAFAGRMARAFGNDAFEAIEPAELVLWAIDNHDRGWTQFDEQPRRNPETGLPYNVVGTPPDVTLQTLNLGPDYNESHHPYCGLINAMHMYGVYTGRYGLSDRIIIDIMPQSSREQFLPVLDGLLKRQKAIKEQLQSDPAMAAFRDEKRLVQNYRQLQLFDQLALYFNYKPAGARGEMVFHGVPRSMDESVSVTVREQDDASYVVTPFPFKGSEVETWCEGHYLVPTDGDDADLKAAFDAAPVERQPVRLVQG